MKYNLRKQLIIPNYTNIPLSWPSIPPQQPTTSPKHRSFPPCSTEHRERSRSSITCCRASRTSAKCKSNFTSRCTAFSSLPKTEAMSKPPSTFWAGWLDDVFTQSIRTLQGVHGLQRKWIKHAVDMQKLPPKQPLRFQNSTSMTCVFHVDTSKLGSQPYSVKQLVANPYCGRPLQHLPPPRCRARNHPSAHSIPQSARRWRCRWDVNLFGGKKCS